jgi:hypothetical protein
MNTQEKNRPDYATRNQSIREQNRRRKDIDRLTRHDRIFKKVVNTVLASVIVGGLAFEAYRVSEPGADAVKLPNITTEQGLNEAINGVRSGNLVEIEALAPYQKLDLKGTDLLVQPRDFSSIAMDSTASLSDHSRGLEEGLIVHEAGGSDIAHPDSPYFVPTTPRSLELHTLEEEANIL